MKALCYSAKLVAGLQAKKNPELAKKFGTFSSKISGARATLRLVDDFPMLQYSLEYGLGKSVNIQFDIKQNIPPTLFVSPFINRNLIELCQYLES